MANVQKQLKEKICPVCGRNYIFHDYWAYKIIIRTKWGTRSESYCSWTCMRKAEEEKEQQKKREKAV